MRITIFLNYDLYSKQMREFNLTQVSQATISSVINLLSVCLKYISQPFEGHTKLLIYVINIKKIRLYLVF